MKQDQWLAGVIGGAFVVVIFVGVAVGIVAGNVGKNSGLGGNGGTAATPDLSGPQVLDFVTLKKIQLDYPTKGQLLVSPIQIVGRASKDWYVNNSIGVKLEDGNGKEIAKGSVATKGIGEDGLLRFEGTLNFVKPATKSVTLILYKQNGKPASKQTEMKIQYNFK